MGSEKKTTTSNQNVTATPEQQQLNALQLQQAQAAQPGVIANNQNALNLSNAMLTGGALPGSLAPLAAGISPAVQNSIANQAVRAARPGLNQGGVLDSGTAASATARTAGDVYNQAAQFNLQNLLQMLNLATGSSAQAQQPISQNVSTLSQSLAGLRNFNTTGTTIGMNPFQKAFETQLGSTAGGSQVRFNFGR